MKMIIALAALVAVATAAPVDGGDNQLIRLVSETPSDNVGLGDYKYGYALSDGSTREETAQFVEAGPEGPVPSVSGSWSWTDPETGLTYLTTYFADKEGFHVKGDHIPV